MKKLFLLILFFLVATCDNTIPFMPEINPNFKGEDTGGIFVKFASSTSRNIADKPCSEIADFYTIVIFDAARIFTYQIIIESQNSISKGIIIPVGDWQILVIAGVMSDQDPNNVILLGCSQNEYFTIKHDEVTEVDVKMEAISNRYDPCPDIESNTSYTLMYEMIIKNAMVEYPDTFEVRRENDDSEPEIISLCKSLANNTYFYKKDLTSPMYAPEDKFTIVNTGQISFNYAIGIIIPFDVAFCGKDWYLVSENCSVSDVKDEISFSQPYVVEEGTGAITIIW